VSVASGGHRNLPVHPVLRDHQGRRDHPRGHQVSEELREVENREDDPVLRDHPVEPEVHPAVHGGRSLHQGLPVPWGVPVAAVGPLAAPWGAEALAAGPADVEEC